MSQRDETTPSPVSKEDGSNKRIIVNQGTNSNKPKQPPALMETAASVPNVAMEITLTSSGPDGKELPNSNPNHNPDFSWLQVQALPDPGIFSPFKTYRYQINSCINLAQTPVWLLRGINN